MDSKPNLSRLVINLCLNQGSSPIRGSRAAGEIRAFLGECGCAQDEIKNLLQDPDGMFGPFEGLPEVLRESLAASAEFYIRERNLLSHSVVRSLAYGPLLRLGGYLVHQGWKLKGGRRDWLHSHLLLMGRRIQRVGRNLAGAFIRLFRYTPIYRAPFFHVLWQYVKLDPGPLVQEYIKKIPVDHRLSPVFKGPGRRVASCGLVGIDFLPAHGKLYFLEGNFNAGHSIERHLISPEGDTVCRHLADWAAKGGYSKIVFFPNNHSGVFDKKLEDAWRHIALSKGVQLEIVDYPAIGSPWPRSRRMLMDLRSPDTLFVNGRYLFGPLARLIAEKGLLDREIGRFNDGVPGEARIPVPRELTDREEVPPLDAEGPFPNIIVKNARLDKTEGIVLYKSKFLPEGVNSRPNIAYEYVVPDLIEKEDRGTIQYYVCSYRAYLLITPDGPVYLGAKKGVSSVAVPRSLPLGKVKDKSPYIANRYTGAYHAAHSEAEDLMCRSAILSVGAVIDRFIRDKYRLVIEEP
ncbi:MAG: hypothetical protein R6X21_01900 [Candidatus Aminicenantes bacterium]